MRGVSVRRESATLRFVVAARYPRHPSIKLQGEALHQQFGKVALSKNAPTFLGYIFSLAVLFCILELL
jgi:hypothetical protein